MALDLRDPGLRHSSKFASIVFLLLLLMVGLFCGAPSCKTAVGSQAALTGHQKKCDAYRQFVAAQITHGPSSVVMLPGLAARQRKAPGPPLKRSTTLKERKERLGNADQVRNIFLRGFFLLTQFCFSSPDFPEPLRWPIFRYSRRGHA